MLNRTLAKFPVFHVEHSQINLPHNAKEKSTYQIMQKRNQVTILINLSYTYLPHNAKEKFIKQGCKIEN